MSSTFGGLEMGKSALNAFRLGMQTVGHNISNMGTEGYSRQRVNYATNTPMDMPGVGQVGQGMHVSDIERIRDEFLDFQFRDTQTALGYWEKVSQLYDSIQNYISEPNSSGIRDAMNTFFTDLQTLQQSPEDTSTRRSLVESARSLGSMLSALTDNFETYNKSVNMEIQSSVADINRMLYDIAALNKEIAQAEALDQNANDLRDSRDLILDKLSKMIDITYNEPLESKDGVPGEFFVTLNGRAIVQGTHVRELKAHAFMWDNQVYYDVQVAENEFDIVSNPGVADILAAGPEGNYLLSVDRIANGVEWTTGGGDAHCLEVRSAVTSSFAGGVILNDESKDIPYKLSFRVLDTNGEPQVLTIKIDKESGGWKLRAELDGNPETDSNGDVVSKSITTSDLTIEDLADFINTKASSFTIGGITQDPVNLKVTADTANNTLTFTSDDSINADSPVEITDYSGMLGPLTEVKAELTQVNMRSRVNSIDEALNISGSFRIQVGTQGTRVKSKIFKDNPSENLKAGQILSTGTAGEKHTFRIGVSDDQVDITASWNDSTKQWTLSSDLGNSVTDTDGVITVEEFAKFLSDTITRSKTSGDNSELSKLKVVAGSNQFYIESSDNHLISISDVEGDLAARMDMVNDNPVITIDVESSDSLATIRNKINEKYQAELGITKPEQWVHASLHQDSDQSWYLTIAADVAGEAQRITLMGAEDGNMQVLRRLGLTKNEEISVDINGTETPSFREVAYIPSTGIAQDASFSFNGVRYLSSDNMFKEARRIPNVNTDGSSNYSATALSEVSEGMWFNLKNAGVTSVTVKHHVQGGSVKGLEEVRDGFIPDMKDALNEVAFNLAKNFNAYQYSGYGIASEINTTGTAFFTPLATKAGAAKALTVSDEISANISLIGAAMGLKDSNGIASSGKSGGSGDGTNASRMVNLNWEKLVDGTTTLSGVYDAMLTEIGAEAAYANLMYKTQQTVSDQIDSQRQAVSGVNL
ncbi:MAG: flagellar hook-associated protein FlgK, partial [Synergistaceae bacterium]|nr:flagellar hook-associated protein FlgK [Synergistaceae bacterium]